MVRHLSYVFLITCLLQSWSVAEPPIADKPLSKELAESSKIESLSPPPEDNSGRFQLLSVGTTTLLLDKVSGDTWRLVTRADGQPFWETVTRKKRVSHPEKIDDAEPRKKLPTASETPEPKRGESLFHGPAVAGPVDVQLIPGLDIVVVRGPEASVRAVKEAVADMGRAWNAPRATKPQLDSEKKKDERQNESSPLQ